MLARVTAWLTLLVIVAGLAHADPVAATPTGPSFPCPQTGEIEAAICSDPALAADDRRMRTLYDAARPGALGRGSNQLAAQRKWLKERAGCGRDGWKQDAIIGVESLHDCIALQYGYRLEALAIADLFTAHDAAISELGRKQGHEAQVYQALYLYGTIADPPRRAKAVGALIAPIFAPLRVHPPQDDEGIQIPAMPEFEFEHIPTAEIAAATDDNFSAFLKVAAGWDIHDMIIPCGFLARRPGVLFGFNERWSPRADCDDELPATPRFDRLANAAGRTAPFIDGTIRIDIGASYQVLDTAARLNLPAHWKGPAKSWILGEPQARIERRFRARHGRDIAAATAEMTLYYSRTFHLPPAAARVRARQVVSALISANFFGG